MRAQAPMHISVCMYEYVYAYMNVRMMRAHECAGAHALICLPVFMYISMHVCIYVCMCFSIYACMCVRA